MRSGRVISIIVCAVLLFSLPVPAALADNVWNLPGGMLLKAVRENERYNGYSALTYLKIQDSAAAVMANTAIATAGDIEAMAGAFRKAIEAGRSAYLAGTGRVLEKGSSASSPPPST